MLPVLLPFGGKFVIIDDTATATAAAATILLYLIVNCAQPQMVGQSRLQNRLQHR